MTCALQINVRKLKKQSRIDIPETLALLGTQDDDNQNNKIKPNKTQKAKKMSNTDYIRNRGWTQVLVNDKQFHVLIKHPPCYSYIQSKPVKELAAINKRKHLRKKKKIHYHLRCGYFVTVNQIVMTTVEFLERWLQPRSNVAFASVVELCPETHSTGHKL